MWRPPDTEDANHFGFAEDRIALRNRNKRRMKSRALTNRAQGGT